MIEEQNEMKEEIKEEPGSIRAKMSQRLKELKEDIGEDNWNRLLEESIKEQEQNKSETF